MSARRVSGRTSSLFGDGYDARVRRLLVLPLFAVLALAPAAALAQEDTTTVVEEAPGDSAPAVDPGLEPAVTTVPVPDEEGQSWIYTMLPPLTAILLVAFLVAVLIGAFYRLVIQSHTRRKVPV